MKRPTLFKQNTNAIALSLLLLAAPQTVFAGDTADSDPANPYSSAQTVVFADGTSRDLVISIVNSPPPPPQAKLAVKSLVSAVPKIGDVKIAGVPAFSWSYGSAATAGAMIAGYYDRVGFAEMYTGPTDGGCMPLTNVSWGTSDKGGNECPLSATRQDIDGRIERGHVDDYYVKAGDIGPDPYDDNGWDEHTPEGCTGDFMKSSKWFPETSTDPVFIDPITKIITPRNTDGQAVFIFSLDGEKVTASILEEKRAGNYKPLSEYDAGYGLKLFFESIPYQVKEMYNQYVDTVRSRGFTYNEYKTEIDARRPVMLHLEYRDDPTNPTIILSQNVVGIGYNNLTNEIIFHSTLDGDDHTMLWGGTGIYNIDGKGYKLNAVTIVTLADAIPSAGCGTTPGKFPWTMFLPAITVKK